MVLVPAFLGVGVVVLVAVPLPVVEVAVDAAVVVGVYDIIHNNDIDNTQSIHHNYDLFQLEHHHTQHIHEINIATECFLSIYNRYTSPDLRHVSRLLTINRSSMTKNPLSTLIYTLYRILYFNTHTLPVANLSDTSIFLIHPIYARINHSCRKNTLLQIVHICTYMTYSSICLIFITLVI